MTVWWAVLGALAAPPCVWDPQPVTPGARPSLAVDGAGALHLVVVDGGTLRLLVDQGATWRTEDLGPAVGGELGPGGATIARTTCAASGSCEVAVGSAGPEGWRWTPVEVAASQITVPVWGSDRDLVYAVRRDGASFSLRHAHLADGGPRISEVGLSTAARPAVAVDEDGTVHVAYRPAALADKLIRHAWREGDAWREEVLNPDAGIAGGLWFARGALHASFGDLGGVKVARRAEAGWTEVTIAPETAWTRATPGGMLVIQGFKSGAVRAAVPSGGALADFATGSATAHDLELGSSADSDAIAVAAGPGATCPTAAWVDRDGKVKVATPR